MGIEQPIQPAAPVHLNLIILFSPSINQDCNKG